MADFTELLLLESGSLILDGKELYTIDELVQSTGKTRQTIYNWEANGKLIRMVIKGRPLFYYTEE